MGTGDGWSLGGQVEGGLGFTYGMRLESFLNFRRGLVHLPSDLALTSDCLQPDTLVRYHSRVP